VGQAVSSVELLFTQARQLGAIAVPGASPKLTHGAELPTNHSVETKRRQGDAGAESLGPEIGVHVFTRLVCKLFPGSGVLITKCT
jgi:hypothetical protein